MSVGMRERRANPQVTVGTTNRACPMPERRAIARLQRCLKSEVEPQLAPLTESLSRRVCDSALRSICSCGNLAPTGNWV